MNISVHATSQSASAAAAALLMEWIALPQPANVMLAGGNTPLELYRLVGAGDPRLSQLTVFALDEYVGVPPEDPRTCAHLIRRAAVLPWGVSPDHFFSVSSDESLAAESIRRHEKRIESAGGIDVLVLGLGVNGHLGFNEPGSAGNSGARVVDLDAGSVEANRQWFQGEYAPQRGATVGMKTILGARRIMLLAFGAHKASAVAAMLEGPQTSDCPASLLRGHSGLHIFLDAPATAGLRTPR